MKTDRQDAVKIARYVRDTADSNIVRIPVPTQEESDIREVMNYYDFAKKHRTMLINKLHAIFNLNGIHTIKKSDLSENISRIDAISAHLDGLSFEDACMVESLITITETHIEAYRERMRRYIIENPDIALPWLSLPGIGLITATSLLAYAGDCSRFYSPKQLRNYVGLVPRINQSGDHSYIGGVSSYGCKTIRKNIMQAGWPFEHRSSDCPLKQEWDMLEARKKRKQTVAIHMANKLLSIGWTLQRKKELYNGFGDCRYLMRKQRMEKLEAIDTSSFPDLG